MGGFQLFVLGSVFSVIVHYLSVETKPHRDESREELLGRIGGRSFSKKDNWINIFFLIVILGLFVVELSMDYLPRLMSLELGILMVSIKIVFMMHSEFHRVPDERYVQKSEENGTGITGQ